MSACFGPAPDLHVPGGSDCSRLSYCFGTFSLSSMAETIHLNVMLPGLGRLTVGEIHHVLKGFGHLDHSVPVPEAGELLLRLHSEYARKQEAEDCLINQISHWIYMNSSLSIKISMKILFSSAVL